jgi:hypothetical protein
MFDLAENDPLRPLGNHTRKWPKYELFADRNRQGFLATPLAGPKHPSGQASTPACPATIRRLFPYRLAR